eukprot:9466411-Pyramimonas_sp.AAC.1
MALKPQILEINLESVMGAIDLSMIGAANVADLPHNSMLQVVQTMVARDIRLYRRVVYTNQPIQKRTSGEAWQHAVQIPPLKRIGEGMADLRCMVSLVFFCHGGVIGVSWGHRRELSLGSIGARTTASTASSTTTSTTPKHNPTAQPPTQPHSP